MWSSSSSAPRLRVELYLLCLGAVLVENKLRKRLLKDFFKDTVQLRLVIEVLNER